MAEFKGKSTKEKCAICEEDFNPQKEGWFSELGYFLICGNCLDTHTKIELLGFVDGEGI